MKISSQEKSFYKSNYYNVFSDDEEEEQPYKIIEIKDNEFDSPFEKDNVLIPLESINKSSLIEICCNKFGISKDQTNEFEKIFDFYVKSYNNLNKTRFSHQFQKYKVLYKIEEKNLKDSISSLVFSENGESLVTVDLGGRAFLWDCSKMEQKQVLFESKSYSITAVCYFNKDVIISSKDINCGVKNLNSNRNYLLGDGVLSIAAYFSEERQIIVCGLENNKIKILNFKSDMPFTNPKEIVLHGHKQAVVALAISKDGKKIVSGSSDKSVILWDIDIYLGIDEAEKLENNIEIKRRKYEKEMKKMMTGHEGPINAVAITNNNKKVISSGSTDQTIRVWNAITLTEEFKINLEENVNTLALSPNNIFIVSGTEKNVALWNLKNGKKMENIYSDVDVSSIVISPDQKQIAFGDSSGSIYIYNLFNYETFFNLQQIMQLFYHPDNYSFKELLISLTKENFIQSLCSYPYNVIYPYDISLFHIFASNDFLLCKVYKIFPTISYQANTLNKLTPLQIAMEKNNKNSIKTLIKFYVDNMGNKPNIPIEITPKILTILVKEEKYVQYILKLLDNKLIDPKIALPKIHKWRYESDKILISESKLPQKITFTKALLPKAADSIKYDENIYPMLRKLNIKNILKIPENGENSFIESCITLEPSHDIFGNQVFESIVNYKWEQYARKIFLIDSLRYFVLLILITANSVFIMPKTRKKGKSNVKWSNLADALMILILINLVFTLVIEIMQLVKLGWRNYLSDFWNILDIIIICSGFALTISDFFVYSKELQAITLVAIWLRILNVFRGFKGTSFFVRSLFQVFKDIFYFLCIIIVFLFILTFSIFVLQKNDTVNNRWTIFQGMYNLLLGDFEKYNGIAGTVEKKDKFLVWIIFLFATVIVMIILMNLLIAIVCESFNNFLQNYRKANLFEKTNLIYEIEKTMMECTKKKINDNIHEYLFIIYRHSPDYYDEDEEVWEDKFERYMNEMNKNIEKVNENLQDRIQSIENKIGNLR